MTGTDYIVGVECEGGAREAVTEDLVSAFLALDPYGGVVTSTAEASPVASYGALFCVDAMPNRDAARDRGLALFQKLAASVGLPELPVVNVEVMTPEERDTV